MIYSRSMSNICWYNCLVISIIDVMLCYRLCPNCGLVYRYQGHEDGLHNYDDYHCFSLSFLLLLRAFVEVMRIKYHTEILVFNLFLHNHWLRFTVAGAYSAGKGCIRGWQYCWREAWSNNCAKCLLPLWGSYRTRLQFYLCPMWKLPTTS